MFPQKKLKLEQSAGDMGVCITCRSAHLLCIDKLELQGYQQSASHEHQNLD